MIPARVNLLRTGPNFIMKYTLLKHDCYGNSSSDRNSGKISLGSISSIDR